MVNTTYSGKPPIVAAVAFTALAIASHRQTPLPGDVWIARAIQRWDAQFPMNIAQFGNLLGEAVPIGIVAIIIALSLALRRLRFEAGFVVVAFVANVFNSGLKWIVGAHRPTADLVRVTEHRGGGGFPSGHVMGVALVLGAAALMLSRRAPRFGSLVWAIAAAAIVITAFGRVFAGAHWPSQTVGGLLAAIALLGFLDWTTRTRRASPAR